jgi:competence protein ComEA
VAAGGYGPEADLLEAAKLNLAAPLTDGQQVFVPLRGSGGATSGPEAGGGAGALVNLNTATPEQLDTLPGIGPVTVQKIVAARQERPFASLEELTERKVLTSSQVDKIRDLVTLG